MQPFTLWIVCNFRLLNFALHGEEPTSLEEITDSGAGIETVGEQPAAPLLKRFMVSCDQSVEECELLG